MSQTLSKTRIGLRVSVIDHRTKTGDASGLPEGRATEADFRCPFSLSASSLMLAPGSDDGGTI